MIEWRRVVFMQLQKKLVPSSLSSSCAERCWYVSSITVQSARAFRVSTQRWSWAAIAAAASPRWKTNGALWGQTDSSSSSSSCSSSVSPRWLISSRNYFLRDLRHGEWDGGPACVLGLFDARVAEALERPEHLQTEGNEAARPPRTNQFSSTLKELRRNMGS